MKLACAIHHSFFPLGEPVYWHMTGYMPTVNTPPGGALCPQWQVGKQYSVRHHHLGYPSLRRMLRPQLLLCWGDRKRKNKTKHCLAPETTQWCPRTLISRHMTHNFAPCFCSNRERGGERETERDRERQREGVPHRVQAKQGQNSLGRAQGKWELVRQTS